MTEILYTSDFSVVQLKVLKRFYLQSRTEALIIRNTKMRENQAEIIVLVERKKTRSWNTLKTIFGLIFM